MDTWNPITGCLHNCLYCWARNYAKRLATMDVEPYKTHGFKPTFVERRLKQRFPRGKFVFVSDMGDMWGEWVPREWILKVLKVLRSKPRCSFLFLTKNPKRYHEFQGLFTENMMLGATIETNREYNVTKATPPRERFEALKGLDWGHKAVVVEPILDFDLEFIDWIKELQPELVYVGYDNYHYNLPEPQLSKTWMLVKELRGTAEVVDKSLRKAWFE
ncbi:MAG: phage Gp37/Gp68 family protein [Candidatus Bathyarchaeota archaeon]|nr:phage Gp37/Gp68 family protein [Candidatus Bathyarchaeota archaeon]